MVRRRVLRTAIELKLYDVEPLVAKLKRDIRNRYVE